MENKNYSRIKIRETNEEKEVRITSDSKPQPGDEIVEKWQSLLDLTAKIMNVPFELQLKRIMNFNSNEDVEHKKNLKKELSEFKQNIESIEERYAVGKINEEMYLKFLEKYKSKSKEVEEKLENLSPTISNFEEKLQKAIEFTQNVARYWAYGTVRTKERIQNLLFPEGILIDIPNRQYLTSKVNPLFQAKVDYRRKTEGQKKENPSKNGGASFKVAGTRLELVSGGCRI